jgi:hypothetical protein
MISGISRVEFENGGEVSMIGTLSASDVWIKSYE